MNLLIDKINEVVVDGKTIVIVNPGFKTVLKYIRLIESEHISDEYKAMTSVRMFLGPEYTLDINTGIKAINKFLNRDYEDSINSGDKEQNTNANDRLMDYEIDSSAIYASFMQVYGIDLIKTDLHWYAFSSLLSALPEDCTLSKIIHIRTMTIPKVTNDNESYVAKLIKAKNDLALK